MPRPVLRALGRTLATTVLAGSLLLPATGIAAAHDQLIDSSPAADQHLDSAPTEIRLTFSAEVMDVGTAVRVIDAADADWTDGEPVLDGPVVTVPLDPELPEGAYRAAWRVVSSDGHAISGVVPFTVGEADPVAAMSAEQGDGAAREQPAVSAAPQTAAVSDTTPASESGPATDGPLRTVLIAAGGAVLAGGLYALGLWLRRRRSGADPTS
ncbi:copper resistance CopC family protein [Cellulomonas sp. NPDC089187]|uniref:copper resistance CopC family protein n=1 Tax=Cellulomonas sp. NPDC089187 TaxID=3154970 RepID=UPI00344AEC29